MTDQRMFHCIYIFYDFLGAMVPTGTGITTTDMWDLYLKVTNKWLKNCIDLSKV